MHRSVGYRAPPARPRLRAGRRHRPGRRVDRWSPEDRACWTGCLRTRRSIASHVPEPSGPTGWRATRATRWLRRSRRGCRAWVEGAVEARDRARRATPISILASCVPVRDGRRRGRGCRAALGVPWIADLEDPWALDEMRVHADRARTAAPTCADAPRAATASAVITCARGGGRADAARRCPSSPTGRSSACRSASSRDSFDGERGRRARRRRHFRIVHTGSMHTELGDAPPAQPARRRRLLGGTSRRRRHPHAVARLPARGDRALDRARAGACRADRGRTSPAR